MRVSLKNSFMLLLLLVGAPMLGACEAKCESDSGNEVRDVVDEAGDEVEEVIEEIKD